MAFKEREYQKMFDSDVMQIIYILILFISVIDLLTYRIPDLLLLGIVGYGLTLPYVFPRLGCALFVGFLIWVIRCTSERVLHRPVLGDGDIKLMACCGFFLTLDQVGLFIAATGFFASVACILLHLRILPLAPAILLGFWLANTVCVENMIAWVL